MKRLELCPRGGAVWRAGMISVAVGAAMFLASPVWSQQPAEPEAAWPAAAEPATDAQPDLTDAEDARTEAPPTDAAKPTDEKEPDLAKTADEVTMTHQGEFVRADEDSFTMTHEGQEHSHRLGENASITLNGRPVELSDLRPGDKLRVTTPKTELGTAVAITATRESDEVAAGQPQEQPSREEDQQGARGAVLGVLLDEANGEGALVREVAPRGAAAQAGIRPGDLITSFNGQAVSSPQELAEAVGRMQPGDEVRLGVLRNEREMNVAATLGRQRALGFRQDEAPEGDRRGADRERGRSPRAWLGVMLRETRPQRPPREGEAEEGKPPKEQQGAVVADVHPNSPAAHAGVRRGDVIVRVGEHAVNTLDDLYQAMEQVKPDEEIALVVKRDGEEEELNVTPSAREEFFFGGPGFPGGREGGFRPPFGEFTPPDFPMGHERDQRLEELLNDVLKEVKQLRQEVQELKSGRPAQKDQEDDQAPPAEPAPPQ